MTGQVKVRSELGIYAQMSNVVAHGPHAKIPFSEFLNCLQIKSEDTFVPILPFKHLIITRSAIV